MSFADIVADVLEVDADQLADTASPATLGNWTSIRHLQLVVTLEEVYGLSFSRNEIKAFRTIGDIRSALTAKGVTV